MSKWVYSFGDGVAEGNVEMKNLLGGKGANLAQMAKIGLPVPPGFTITTEVCNYYYKSDEAYPSDLTDVVEGNIRDLENKLGKKFGDVSNPLLVSVRSGARVSMPGMMDTVLNLGLNDEVVEGLALRTNNVRFAYDSYRRFIQMYADVVLGVDHYNFEQILDLKKEDRGVTEDVDLNGSDLKELVGEYKKKVNEILGYDFPQDPYVQLWGAISAVFSSWMIPRAVTYRRMNEISEDWGTAVNIQSMVFGNMGDDCATGVCFTRNPATGEKTLYGEYLINAQGEDVVAGIRTPCPITLKEKAEQCCDMLAMEETMPAMFVELEKAYNVLESHYRDMQDIEFTIENNKLWILQTRSGKRTAKASIKIAVDMVEEGIIDKNEALMRVEPQAIDQLLHPTLDSSFAKKVLCKGLPASPGAAVGKIVFSAEEAVFRAHRKEKVLLVRVETSPEDISGMNAAQGILTARGGMTSHAAVVARGMGKPCVSGVADIKISYPDKTLSIGSAIYNEGDILTIDGGTGEVIAGEVPTVKANLSGDFTKLMEWADGVRDMKIRTNAETPNDCKTARDFGAEGIGLCRTEHMFFESDRIIPVREMILANDEFGRKVALKKLLPIQTKDFLEIFKIMDGLPVNIRLLDPPLHEFLPHKEEELVEVAKASDVSVDVLKSRMAALHESNPMLGHRGSRLGITYPEIYEMQTEAIFTAAAKMEIPEDVSIELMLPLVFDAKELKFLKERVLNVISKLESEYKCKFSYQIGTMIELPRAALRAKEIAEYAEYFSFGTNDLTQTTYGISRDDSANFIGDYIERRIIETDPFVRLDQDGVGELIEIAADRGRKTRANIKLGICGEHGGDPKSIEFCHSVGMDYVSCSPYRVPIARLAAAQAVLRK